MRACMLDIEEMGGKMHASSMASPVECCMCGDPGLEEELFKCRNCSVRLQHKYCSNLYPKLDGYLVCNWCLGQEGPKLQAPRESACSSGQGFVVGVKVRHHGAFAPLDVDERRRRPINKQRLPPDHRRKPMTSTSSSELKTLSSGLGRAKPAMCRARVRRYKLLEEVCS